MSIDAQIITAVKTVIDDVSPNVYTGTKTTYCVYTYNELLALNAESKPNAIRYLIMVNLYMPNGKNPNTLKKALCHALWSAGFTYPTITNASDPQGQHYSLECEGWSCEPLEGL